MKRRIAILCALLVLLGLFWFWRTSPRSAPHEVGLPTKPEAATMQSPGGSGNAATAQKQATPVTDMAAVEAEYKRARLEKMRAIAEKSNEPIQFFGLVLDQDNSPIPGVKVTLSIRTAKETKPGVIDDLFEHPVVTTGLDGRFTLTDARGALLSVEALEKNGYDASEKGLNRAHYWYWRDPSQVFHPDANRPEIFRMWEKAGAERLVRKGIGHAIPYDDKPTSFDLLSGTTVAGGGDLRVTLTRNPQQIQWGQTHYEWTATVEVVNGGVIESSDEQMYRAPAEGYASKFVVHMAADDPQWTDTKDVAAYLKLRDGKYYGRVELKFMVGADRKVTPFSVVSFVNPSGSQNLEYDPLQDVALSARPQTAVKP